MGCSRDGIVELWTIARTNSAVRSASFPVAASKMQPLVPEGRAENSPGWREAESWEGVFLKFFRPGGAVRTSLGTLIVFMGLPYVERWAGAGGLCARIH